MSRPERVIRVFELTGMPDGEHEANKAAEASVRLRGNIHVHDEELNRYFIIQVADVSPIFCNSVRRLDRENAEDMNIIAKMIGIAEQAYPERV